MKKVLLKQVRPDLQEAYTNEWVETPDSEIVNKSRDEEREQIKREFEVLKGECRELILTYLNDPNTSKDLRDYLLSDSRVKKLMLDVPEYQEQCKENNLKFEGGRIYDSSYE
jgi:hypothetical protein